MADVWVLLLIFAFFAACVGLVRGVDRIIGPDDSVDVAPAPDGDERAAEPVPAAR